MIIQRKGRDMDPVRPWVWADMPFHPDPVEIVSYPIPAGNDLNDLTDATIMVRLLPGDPTSLREVPFKHVACFSPDRHEWWYERRRIYYSDNPTAFMFADEIGRVS